MIIKKFVEEDFINYKKPSMFIAFPRCTWKCEKECGEQVCQNGTLANAPDIDIAAEDIALRYISNPITSAVVLGGLEPFDSPRDLREFIEEFRKVSDDDIVIYTGYTERELYDDKQGLLKYLTEQYDNIIVKFGRYIPGQQKHYDEMLGVNLASDNQYAQKYR